MTVMNRFSEKEAEYHLYQARQNYLRERMTIALELEQALRDKAAALGRTEESLRQWGAESLANEAALEREKAERQAKEAERRAKEAALAQLEELNLRLREGPGPQDKGS